MSLRKRRASRSRTRVFWFQSVRKFAGKPRLQHSYEKLAVDSKGAPKEMLTDCMTVVSFCPENPYFASCLGPASILFLQQHAVMAMR